MTDEQKSEESKPKENSNGGSDELNEPARKQAKSTPKPSRAARVVRWLFRMLVVILLGIALGGAIYYGARNFYRDAIEPLQTIDQRMSEAEAGVSELGENFREARSSTAEELTELQSKTASQAEEIASLSAQITRLESQIESQAETLGELDDLRDGLSLVVQDLEETNERLQALESTIAAGELPAERVRETLQLMRVMNLMTRARLWIEQDNFGLAGEDIQVALSIAELLTADADPESEPGSRLLEITDRLAEAEELVRSNPSLAEEELELVWKLLLEASAP